MQDTNIIIRQAHEGYVVKVNSPKQTGLEALTEMDHVFLTLDDLKTFVNSLLVDGAIETQTEQVPTEAIPAPETTDAPAAE